MRSDIVEIDNSGLGFRNAREEANKVAVYKNLSEDDSVQLQILTEEMLSLAQSITGKLDASFWIEMDGDQADLHMTTKAVLDKEKRAELIESSTSRRNEAGRSFLGRLRNMFEEAMASEPTHYQPSRDILSDLPQMSFDEPDWDGYERSILRNLADDVKIGIHSSVVDITVSKRFGIQE